MLLTEDLFGFDVNVLEITGSENRRPFLSGTTSPVVPAVVPFAFFELERNMVW